MALDVFDPTGTTGKLLAYAARLDSIENRKIGILNNESWQAHRILPYLLGELGKRFPSTTFEMFSSGDRHIQQDEMIDRIAAAGCHGVITGNGAGGEGAVECGRAAAKLEQRGIPAVVLCSHAFIGVARNNVAGLGFAADIASVTFPVEQFMLESDMKPVAAALDRFVEGLTRWQPNPELMAEGKPAMISIPGNDHSEIARNLNALFLRRQWGDGLAITPPTADLVDWILEGTDLPRQTEFGRFLPRGGVVTLEMLAVSLAMAGGRPEYLPVLIGAIKAVLNPEILHEKWQTTSCSTFPAFIVNGPMARQIRLNCGFGLLGPDPAHPAGGSIGRAIRLLQQNLGGSLPGVGTMGVFGEMRYTNAVFAEDDSHLPPGWESFSTEYMGFPKGANVVSVAVVSGSTNILRRGRGSESLEDEAVNGLRRVATYMRSHNANSLESYFTGTPGLLILTPTVVKQMAELGWDKAKIRQCLWDNTKIPREELERSGVITWIVEYGGLKETLKQAEWPITSRPENFAIIVGGGNHTTHAHWMQTAFVPKIVGEQIVLPRNWEKLIAEAEKDLGQA